MIATHGGGPGGSAADGGNDVAMDVGVEALASRGRPWASEGGTSGGGHEDDKSAAMLQEGALVAAAGAAAAGRRVVAPMACLQCRQRKAKCDGSFPCSRCSRLSLGCRPQVQCSVPLLALALDKTDARPMVDLFLQVRNTRSGRKEKGKASFHC